jgi:hypothetical protein
MCSSAQKGPVHTCFLNVLCSGCCGLCKHHYHSFHKGVGGYGIFEGLVQRWDSVIPLPRAWTWTDAASCVVLLALQGVALPAVTEVMPHVSQCCLQISAAVSSQPANTAADRHLLTNGQDVFAEAESALS